MNRRDVLAGIATVSASVAAGGSLAQDRGGRLRIGFVGAVSPMISDPFFSNFKLGLAENGWVPGPTWGIEPVYAQGAMDRLPDLVAGLERAGASVIVTHAQATAAVVRAPRSVPVVYQFSADPVASGLAASLSQPLFNATGITLMAAELNVKRLDLLREIAPGLRRVAVVYNPLHPGENLERGWIEGRGRELGFVNTFHPADSRSSLRTVLEGVAAADPEALLILSDGFTVENRAAILEVGQARKIPCVSGWEVMAESGALFTLGPRLAESYRRAGYYVDRIVRGAKPAALPIEQPTVIELVVNLAVSRQIGLALQPSLLARADRVIET